MSNYGRPTQNYLEHLMGTADGHFKTLTAAQFISAWNNYDRDGNGFIEGKELEKFLRDFFLAEHAASSHGGQEGINRKRLFGAGWANKPIEFREDFLLLKHLLWKIDFEKVSLTNDDLKVLKQRFLQAHDANKDGKIDIRELAKLLPIDENFFLIFRYNIPLESGVDFIRIWKKFDKDYSGQIDVTELKEFLRQLIHLSKPRVEIDDATLKEYANTIMKIYDTTKTGKLKLSEMAKLLPVNATFLNAAIKKGSRRKLTSDDITKVLNVYDKDGSGTIEGEELTGLVKDLLAYHCMEYDINDLEDTKKALLSSCDSNSDGRINLRELGIILNLFADETEVKHIFLIVGKHLKDPYNPANI